MDTVDTKNQFLSDPVNKEALLNKAYTLAFNYEVQYGNCPQCVLAAVQEVLPGIVDDALFKAGHGLAGGTALTGKGTCGALVGALLAVSAVHGRDRQNFATGLYGRNLKLGKKVYDKFVAEFGSCVCEQVQAKIMGRGFNLLDREDYKAFEAAGGHVDKCPNVAGKATMWAVELLLDEKPLQKR